MKLKKKFTWSSIIGILLIVLQIIMYIFNYKSYETSIDILGYGHFVLFPSSISDIFYLLGYSLVGIIGIILILFERKKKNK